jgi:hypothetical protein
MPCKKCLGTDIYTRYHDGKYHCRECKDFNREPASCRFNHCDYSGEHLRKACRNCGFEWNEEIANAQG